MSTQDLKISFTGKSIAKNTLYNLLGYIIPTVFALIAIPFLLKGLGQEKFGILNLAWIIIGYFSFFDFGIGRALTKIIAEKIASNDKHEIPGVFWTSLFLMLVLSIVGAVSAFLLSPFLINKLHISSTSYYELLYTFYLLALSIPIITTTAGLRGVLEAYQRFGAVNIIRTLLGILTFLGPLVCLIFTQSLVWIIGVLVIIRVLIWVLYLLQSFKTNSNIKNNRDFNFKLIKSILKLSGWMTISNLVIPIFVYLDKFLIGTLVSASAIAYYVTPNEIISKLQVIPGSLCGVLFPTFSANHMHNPDFVKKVSLRAVKYVFIVMFPVILILVVFAKEILILWLGKEFAANSAIVFQLLAGGILFTSLAYIPYTLLEGIGYPDLTAKIQLTELPLYVFSLWFAVKFAGINGAALVWFIRAIVDALLLFIISELKTSGHIKMHFNLKFLIIPVFFMFPFISVFVESIGIKILFTCLALTLFMSLLWKKFLLDDEKFFFISRIKSLDSNN